MQGRKQARGWHAAKLRVVHNVTNYLLHWWGNCPAYNEWLLQEELAPCQEKVEEYYATAQRHSSLRPLAPQKYLPHSTPIRR